LNVKHNNPTAEKIAQEQLRELCDAIGIVRMTDTVELHNKPVAVRLKIRKDDTGQYEDQNEVVGFKPATGGAGASSAGSFPPAQRAAAPAAAAPAAAAAATPPWAKKTAA
jgi:hypothetical protein